tara:strand:- start:540 stop:1247 length:708 start_codon:yes stop_codon:yes gene_type:complete
MLNKNLYDNYVSTLSEMSEKIPHYDDHNIMVVNEVVKGDCYQVKKCVEQSKTYDILIDVGSNIGTVSLMFLTNNVCNYSYCIESDKNFSKIHKNMNKYYNLDDKCTIENLFVDNNSSDVVSNIIEKNKEKRILLKMDIEGYEFYILDDLLKKNLFKYVTDFVIEIHENKHIPDINTTLKQYKWIEPYKENISKNREMLENLLNKISNSMGKNFSDIEHFEMGQNYDYILGTVTTI